MALKGFNNQKLRNKFLIIYLVGFLLPVIAINSIFSYNTYLEQVEFNEQYYEKTIEKAQLNILNQINSTLQVIYSVYISRDLSTFLKNEYSSMSEYMKNRDRAFYIINQLRLQSADYIIYTSNHTIQSDPIISQITDDVTKSKWYIESKNKKTAANLYYTSDIPDQISIIRALDMNQNRDNSWKNIIKADIPLSKVKKELDAITSDYGISLLSDRGDIVLSNNKVMDNYTYITVDFKSNTLLEGWKLEGRIPKSGFINSKLVSSKLHLFLPQFIIMILGSIIILVLSSSFYTRIYKLSNKMKSVEEGDFKSIKINDKHFDEITKLSISYNIMVEKIDSLINEVSESRLREKNIELVKNKAQISALLSQINPHYLFNVLESIRMKSVIKNETETASIIKHLSKSFRHIISWDQNLITVNEEIGIAKDFLTVQKYRFEEKLEYDFYIDDECENILIPKLTLQPFIENSCIHGIEKSSHNGKIIVKVYRFKKNLICIIEDNGIGMVKEKLNNLKMSLENFEMDSSHIGFSNTFWRLKKIYPNFSLDINSELNQGTRIVLTIPLNKKGEEI